MSLKDLLPAEPPYLPIPRGLVKKNAPTKGVRKPNRDDVEVGSWSERDRLAVWISNKHTGDTIAEWWDEDARSMFEDGFFKEADYERHQKLVGRSFEDSVLDYAEDMGFLEK